jgi:mono/diheme cytochrome c family protein
MRASVFAASAFLCIVTTSSPLRAEDVKLAQQVQEIFKKACARCHGPEGTNEGGMNYVLDVRKLIDKKKIVTGDAAKSKLFKKVSGGEMPPEDEKPQLTKQEIATIEKWIQDGATPFPAAATARAFKTDKDLLKAMRGHLRKSAREDRPYLRYFTLVHAHNSPDVKDEDLRVMRAAVAKLVNSLSWKRSIVVPALIDADGLALAVDVRRLDWDRHGLWNEVLRQYPYGLRLDRSSDESVQEMAREVYELAETDIPMVRADWFVSTASRPPLYHSLLQLPRHATALERHLAVDVITNFQRDHLTRAGFSTSGVSGQNRLVERHESTYGAYWKSYDFKSNEGKGNLFRLSLGPSFADHPFPGLAFQHDGGEVVFNLPNGLQGYLLVNGKDERIDEGPIEVVSDSLKTSGTAKIVNGLSCMACHTQGMKTEFKDTVRAGTAAQGEAREKVRRLYPKPEAMKSLLDQDSERFLIAAEKATGSFLKVGNDKKKDFKDFPEPIGIVARQYLLKELGLAEAALELGLTDATKLQVAIAASDRLRELGLGPLTQGATIKRETWESLSRFISAYQEAASVLGVGTPKRVN